MADHTADPYGVMENAPDDAAADNDEYDLELDIDTAALDSFLDAADARATSVAVATPAAGIDVAHPARRLAHVDEDPNVTERDFYLGR